MDAKEVRKMNEVDLDAWKSFNVSAQRNIDCIIRSLETLKKVLSLDYEILEDDENAELFTTYSGIREARLVDIALSGIRETVYGLSRVR